MSCAPMAFPTPKERERERKREGERKNFLKSQRSAIAKPRANRIHKSQFPQVQLVSSAIHALTNIYLLGRWNGVEAHWRWMSLNEEVGKSIKVNKCEGASKGMKWNWKESVAKTKGSLSSQLVVEEEWRKRFTKAVERSTWRFAQQWIGCEVVWAIARWYAKGVIPYLFQLFRFSSAHCLLIFSFPLSERYFALTFTYASMGHQDGAEIHLLSASSEIGSSASRLSNLCKY